ncbi:MAG: STAS domain-containing protein [Methylococcaceae bacterium]|nr:STAS domain-containing protein [Methylococcaceae bacterium]MCI0732955.1 STAS domain-containing protein [Methylococcaceae bacterium]
MSNAAIERCDGGFSISGEMSFATVNRLLAQSSALSFNANPLLEIDLGRVSRADTAGLALLVEWMARAERGNSEIRYLNMPEQMRDIARVTEVEGLLNLCESRSRLSGIPSRFDVS